MSQKVINKYFIEVISFKKLKFNYLYEYWKSMWIKKSFCGKIINVKSILTRNHTNAS